MVVKHLKMKQKNKKVDSLVHGFLTVGASLLGNLLKGKQMKLNIPEQGVIGAGEGTNAAGQDF